MLHRKNLIIAGGLVVVVAIGLFIWLKPAQKPLTNNSSTNSTSTNQSQTGTNSPSSSTNPPAAASTPSSSASSNNTAKSTTGSNSSSGLLTTPYGSFVSSKTVKTTSSIESQCLTSPGATCVIRFTNSDGVSESLGSQVADGNGSTTWVWSPSGINLNPGSWTITAIATLAGQTKTSTPTYDLTVQQ